MRTLVVLILCGMGFSAWAQIGAKTQSGKIHGVWQNNQFGYQMTLILNTDGSGEFDGESIRFAAQVNTLAITQNGATTRYTFALAGNTLTLSGGDLDGSVAFTRGGTAPAQVAQPAVQPTQPAVAPSQSATGGLTGVWSGNGETVEFKKDGTCLYQGQSFAYQVSQGHVTLSTQQGNVMLAYLSLIHI